MKNMKNLKLGLFALLTCMSTSAFAADDSLQIHGYFVNAGDFSTETERVNVSLHNDPNGDPRGKLGSLGNSYWHDYFTAISLSKKWEGKNGKWADLNYELVSYGDKSVEAGQSYVRFGGISYLPDGATVWAGRRNFSKNDGVFAYNLKDVGIDAGIGYSSKNFDISFGTAQAVRRDRVFGDPWSGFPVTGGVVDSNKILANSKDILDATYRLGKAEVGATYVKEHDDEVISDINGAIRKPQEAISFYGTYNMDKFLGVMPGNTMIMAQYGKGIIAQYLNVGRIDFSQEDDTSMRLTVSGRYDGIKDISIKPTVIVEQTNRDGARNLDDTFVFGQGAEDETALFAGVNVTQKINNNVAMHYEVNVNETKNKNGQETADGNAYKIAAGPSFQLETFEWVRPMISLTASYVGGDKEITGLTKDSEVRFGYQMEAWF